MVVDVVAFVEDPVALVPLRVTIVLFPAVLLEPLDVPRDAHDVVELPLLVVKGHAGVGTVDAVAGEVARAPGVNGADGVPKWIVADGYAGQPHDAADVQHILEARAHDGRQDLGPVGLSRVAAELPDP